MPVPPNSNLLNLVQLQLDLATDMNQVVAAARIALNASLQALETDDEMLTFETRNAANALSRAECAASAVQQAVTAPATVRLPALPSAASFRLDAEALERQAAGFQRSQTLDLGPYAPEQNLVDYLQIVVTMAVQIAHQAAGVHETWPQDEPTAFAAVMAIAGVGNIIDCVDNLMPRPATAKLLLPS